MGTFFCTLPAFPMLTLLPKDARRYQILFLLLFLAVGMGTRDWNLQPGMVLLTLATCLSMQGAVGLARANWNQEVGAELYATLPSALITGLSLSLLLRSNHFSTMMLAGGLAILSKVALRFRDKHIFNPANFGIIAALVLAKDAWVSPGQWGEESGYILLFLSTGGLILQRVGRWDTSIAFLACYAGLEAVRNVWLGWSWDVWCHRLSSGSLLLFALFMLTDPRTIPNARSARLLWAGAIALLTFVLRNQFYLPTAMFWALFCLSPLSPVLDLLWSKAPRFVWAKSAASPNAPAAPVGSGSMA